ncbi:MAG: ATP-binding protein [Candidatus Omnitrophota bacterium]|nr:ATP-binding protein [Candidatus Omnitrophota bacterium]
MIHKESETIEFKKSTSELKEAVISIVAMLNKHGHGVVYFGIDEHDRVAGMTVGRNTIREVTHGR